MKRHLQPNVRQHLNMHKNSSLTYSLFMAISSVERMRKPWDTLKSIQTKQSCWKKRFRTKIPYSPPGKLTEKDILHHHSNIFKPGHGKPLGGPMQIDLEPSVTPVHDPMHQVPVAKLGHVNDDLKRLCEEGIIRPVTQLTAWPPSC